LDAPRPLLIIDTSVFLKDALSRTRSGAATQLLAIAPVVAHIVMCDELRNEVLDLLERHLAWPTVTAYKAYAPIFEAARWLTPVAERADHRLIAHDIDDTMLVRVAEAVYVDALELVAPGQVRYIVSENTRHLRPGSAYAGFLFGTAHDVLGVLKDQPR
jgi:hypothetical protein